MSDTAKTDTNELRRLAAMLSNPPCDAHNEQCAAAMRSAADEIDAARKREAIYRNALAEAQAALRTAYAIAKDGCEDEDDEDDAFADDVREFGEALDIIAAALAAKGERLNK